MTTQKYPCEPFKLDQFDQMPFRFVSQVEIDASAEAIFAVLEEDVSWTEWAAVINEVIWTTPKPFGLGTTRTVKMAGGMVGDEEFIGWEPNRRMSFCFTSASMNACKSFGEDWQVIPQDNGKTLVQWTMALDVTPVNAFFLKIFKGVMGWWLQSMLNNFRKYMHERVAKTGRASA